MRYRLPTKLSGAIGSLILIATISAAQAETLPRFQDPLDTAAAQIQSAVLADQQPMLTVVQAGQRLVAAGLRGLILLSDDQGESWRQAQVPVQSDLTAVHFPTDIKGWAVGHEGVILHSDDGGETWHKQLDGRIAAEVLAPYYQRELTLDNDWIQPYLEQLLFNTEAGAILPYLGVHFEDELTGYVVGAFGMARKTEDGGKSWMPWLHRMDNDHFLNLNDIRAVGQDVYVVGEQGTVFRLDRAADRFTAVHTSYDGSFFGVTGNDQRVIAFGLKGNAFSSSDRGASWQMVPTNVEDSLTAGAVSGDGGKVMLITAGGRLVLSQDGGTHFTTFSAVRPMLYAGITAASSNNFVLAGWHGLVRQPIKRKATPPSEPSEELLP
ncbi:MAG: YCF48-related protein [Pseudomonas sp.]